MIKYGGEAVVGRCGSIDNEASRSFVVFSVFFPGLLQAVAMSIQGWSYVVCCSDVSQYDFLFVSSSKKVVGDWFLAATDNLSLL